MTTTSDAFKTPDLNDPKLERIRLMLDLADSREGKAKTDQLRSIATFLDNYIQELERR